MFQSTRPRGARRAWLTRLKRHKSFNPRARAGRDQAAGAAGAGE